MMRLFSRFRSRRSRTEQDLALRCLELATNRLRHQGSYTTDLIGMADAMLDFVQQRDGGAYLIKGRQKSARNDPGASHE